jgi:hypothetical protein
MISRIRLTSWKTLLTLLLLLTTTAGSAIAQPCASVCLLFYGRVTVRNGEFYWYSSCTTTTVGGEVWYNCRYNSFPPY